MTDDVRPSHVPVLSKLAVNLDELERQTVTSTTVAKAVIVGLPALGLIGAVFAGLSVLAALMAGAFVFGTLFICRASFVTFAGHALRQLVTARLVIVLVVGTLFLCMDAGVTSAVLLWLVADRLLGRRALYDLWRSTKDRLAVAAKSDAKADATAAKALGMEDNTSPKPVPRRSHARTAIKNGALDHEESV